MPPEQKEALEEIKDAVATNGGYVPVVRLIQDSIQIFLDHYKDDAIQRYSSMYHKK